MAKKEFNDQMVKDTLQLWCDNVVEIGKIHSEGGDVKKAAKDILTKNYDYDHGKVLFKPTMTFGPQTFRPTKEGALSYFIGGNSDYPNDSGFKLKPWIKVWYNKLNYILHKGLAILQCNVHFIGEDDSHVFVNKSFVFKIFDDDKIRIILHQSSLPYTPQEAN